MIEASCYSMIVICDGIHYHKGTNTERAYRAETVTAPDSRIEAKKEIENYGWIFKRDGKTYCSIQCEKSTKIYKKYK